MNQIQIIAVLDGSSLIKTYQKKNPVCKTAHALSSALRMHSHSARLSSPSLLLSWTPGSLYIIGALIRAVSSIGPPTLSDSRTRRSRKYGSRRGEVCGGRSGASGGVLKETKMVDRRPLVGGQETGKTTRDRRAIKLGLAVEEREGQAFWGCNGWAGGLECAARRAWLFCDSLDQQTY